MNDYSNIQNYKNNPNLRSANQNIPYTHEQVQEIAKCMDEKTGYLYFISNYFKVVHVDHGLIQYIPRKYQERMLKAVHQNSRIILRSGRQSGKCVYKGKIRVRNKKTGEIQEIEMKDFYEMNKSDCQSSIFV